MDVGELLDYKVSNTKFLYELGNTYDLTAFTSDKKVS